VAFSGLERFIDHPVKHYSSGMFVRLAFSVAMEVDPEILILDEVLSVGDERFRERAWRRRRAA
jgi:lipopolysaccharide transport system ATP-binding protein